MSLGEDRVRTKFNPSNSSAVDTLKQTAAKFIDQCNAIAAEAADPEVSRCLVMAMAQAEDAAMWAVKAATAEKKADAKAA